MAVQRGLFGRYEVDDGKRLRVVLPSCLRPLNYGGPGVKSVTARPGPSIYRVTNRVPSVKSRVRYERGSTGSSWCGSTGVILDEQSFRTDPSREGREYVGKRTVTEDSSGGLV